MAAAVATAMAGLAHTPKLLSCRCSVSSDGSEAATAAAGRTSLSSATWHCAVNAPTSEELTRVFQNPAPRGALRRSTCATWQHEDEVLRCRSFTSRDASAWQPSRIRRRSLGTRASTARIAAPVTDASGETDTWRNPVGLHAMVWIGGWSEAEVRRAVGGSAKLGYDLIEVPVSEPSTVDKEMTKNLLQEFGLGATASMCLSLDADISSPDAEIAAAGEKLLNDAVDVCIGIGAPILAGVTYSALAKYPHAHDKQGRANLVRGMKNVARRAADGGVKIGLEVVNRYETNVINTAFQGVELVEEVDEPNVFVHLDTYHMNIEENSLFGAIELCGEKLQYMHIGESHRGYLGSGQVKWEELFRGLVRAKYKGPLTFESFSSKVVNARLSNDLCVWRNLWDDSEDLARTAKEFIDAQWDAAMRNSVER